MFEASTGDVDLQQRDINGKGERFINSGVQNFGIKGRTDRQAKVFHANTITIDFFGNAYYRPFKYKMATHNHVFSLSGEIIKNEAVGLYLVSQMSYLNKMFSFNNMGTWTEIKKLSLCLPVTSDGSIDFSFMEERMRELEEERMRELEAYLDVAGFSDCRLSKFEKGVLSLFNQHKVKMGLFKILDLYEKVQLKNKDFDKRKDTSQQPSEIFSVPLVNAKHGNNGIMFYGKEDIFPSEEMTIDVVQNGAVATGDVYAQPQKTGVLWDAYLIKATKHQDTENTLLFMVCAIQKTIKLRFNYDEKAVWDRVKRQSVFLPVKESGDVDFELMETYIRAVKKECIARLKTEINREQKVYREVID